MDENPKPKGTFSGVLETAANVLIIVVAVMLIWFIGQRYLFGSPETRKQPELMRPTVGKTVALPGVDFVSRKTVFIALQTTCGYCTESMPFYQRLIQAMKDKDVKFIAVFPTRPEVGIKHLTNHGISSIEVRQAPLSSLDASGTPTIILTDEQGSITNYWIGKLPPEKEMEVIDSISRS